MLIRTYATRLVVAYSRPSYEREPSARFRFFVLPPESLLFVNGPCCEEKGLKRHTDYSSGNGDTGVADGASTGSDDTMEVGLDGDGDGEGGGARVSVAHPDPEARNYLNETLSVQSLFETIADRLAAGPDTTPTRRPPVTSTSVVVSLTHFGDAGDRLWKVAPSANSAGAGRFST
jgi:hypothetical protein